MATSLIEIILRLKDETAAGFKAATSALNGASNAATQLGAAANQAASQFGSFGNAVKGAVASISAFASYQGLKSMAEYSAKIEVAGTVLNIVGKNAGIAQYKLDQADMAIRKMGITADSSRESLTKFIQAGLAGKAGESIDNAAKLARSAQDLAVVSGQNSSDTFARLIVNIQQMDTVGLRHMGLTVDRDLAEQKYAESVGKSVSQLTKQQKQLAFNNATITEADKLSGTYEAAMGNVAKQVQSLDRLQKELTESLGNGLLPAFSAIVLEIGIFLKQARVLAETNEVLNSGSTSLADTMKSVAVAVRETALFLIEHADVIMLIVKAYVAWKVALAGQAIFAGVIGAVGAATRAYAVLTTSIATATTAMRAATTAAGTLGAAIGLIRVLIAPMVAVGVGAYFLAQAIASADKPLVKLLTDMRSFGFIGELIYGVGKLLEALGDIMRGVSAVVVTGLVSPLQTVVDIFEAMFDAIDSRIDKLYNKMGLVSDKELAARNKARADREKDRTTTGFISDQFFGKTDGDSAVGERTKLLSDYKAKQKEVSAAVLTTAMAELEFMKTVKSGTELEKTYAKGVWDAAKLKQAAAEKDAKVLADQIKGVKGLTQAQKDSDEKAVAAINERNEKEAAAEELKQKKMKLGILDKSGLEEGKAYLDLLEALPGVMQNVFELAKKGGPSLGAGMDQARIAMTKLLSDAKSVDQIALALREIGTYSNIAAEGAKSLKENLLFNQEKAAIDEVNSSLVAFSAHLGSLEKMSGLLASLHKDRLTASADLQKAFIELGDAGKSVKEVLLALEQPSFVKRNQYDEKTLAISEQISGLEKTKSKTQELAAIELKKVRDGSAAAGAAYAQEIHQIEDLRKRQIALANERSAAGYLKAGLSDTGVSGSEIIGTGGKTGQIRDLTEQEVVARQAGASRIAAIDADTNNKRIEAAKKYHESLKQLQSEALQGVIAAGQRLVSIELELKNLKKTSDQEQRDYLRKDMTEAERNADKLKELDEVRAARLKAQKDGNIEETKTLLAQEAELIKTAGNENLLTNKQAAEQLLEVRKQQAAALEVEKEQAAKDKADQLKAYQELTTALAELDKTIAGLAKAQVVKVLVSVDENSLKASMESVIDAFGKLDLKVKVSPDTTATGGSYAVGGLVTGQGSDTSDNLLAAVSPGEFWTRARAVRHYGAGLFHDLNNMRIPREAMSSILSSPLTPRFAGGGMVGGLPFFMPQPAAISANGPQFEAAVTVNVGGKKSRLFGDRKNVNGLVESLKALEGTL